MIIVLKSCDLDDSLAVCPLLSTPPSRSDPLLSAAVMTSHHAHTRQMVSVQTRD